MRRLVRKHAIAFGVVAGLLAAGWFHVYGQSPAATARLVLNGKAVEIHYSAPSVRGRRIFGGGGLVSEDPTYPVWRAGANAATTLTTAGDLDVGGLKVPAGTYTLYVLVEDPDAWQLIVNRASWQWGRTYDRSRDLGRVAMTTSTPPAPVETLRYVLTGHAASKGELRLEWENRVASVPLMLR